MLAWPRGHAAAPGRLAPPSDIVDHDGRKYAHHVSVAAAEVTVVHLGANTLFGYRLEAAGRLRRIWAAPAQPGAVPAGGRVWGQRHELMR
jgi:hypothetical protein